MAMFEDMLKGAFGYPAPEPVAAPVAPMPPPEPEKKTYNTRDSVIRDNDPATMVAVQDLVWGNSNPGGPGAPPPAPPSNMGNALSKPSGWGQTGG